MTIEQAFKVLASSHASSNNTTHYDPSYGYITSQCYVYGIAGSDGSNSTVSNLQAVGLDWYKQFNKPTAREQIFISNGKTVFGGPLGNIYYYGDSCYSFSWYYSASIYVNSHHTGYWDTLVSSAYVAVVRARE